MNQLIQTMVERRSCKSYLPDPVPEEILDEIITAGLHAPSAFNTQNPIILKITNKELIAKLSKLNAKYDHLGRPDPYYAAPAVLIILGNKEYPDYLYDGTLVAGNMMNAIAAIGEVGGCWINRAKKMFEDEEGKALLKELNIEGDYEGIANIIVGYPKVMPKGALPRKENRVFEIK